MHITQAAHSKNLPFMSGCVGVMEHSDVSRMTTLSSATRVGSVVVIVALGAGRLVRDS